MSGPTEFEELDDNSVLPVFPIRKRAGNLVKKNPGQNAQNKDLFLPERFEDQTEMAPMVKTTEQSQTMEAIVRVSVVQFFQELQLFDTGLVPGKRTEFAPHEKTNEKFPAT